MESTDLAASAGSTDPRVGLRALASLRRLAEQLESLQVDHARDLGWSWAQIAAELGVSKQAVHQKHGTRAAEKTETTEMFERFSENAKTVLVEAQDLAVELGSRYIGARYVLYGCAEVREETAGRPLHDLGITGASIRRLLPREQEQAAGAVDPDALRAIGIDYEVVRATVEQNFGPGALAAAPDRRVPAGPRKPPFTPEAKRSLELTRQVAIELHAERIVPGHLLLGLLRLDNEHVVAAVEQSGTTVAALSAAVLTRLSAAA